jgi:hypothetical protein
MLAAMAAQNPAFMAQLMAQLSGGNPLLSHPAFVQQSSWQAPPPVISQAPSFQGKRLIDGSLADTTVNTGFRSQDRGGLYRVRHRAAQPAADRVSDLGSDLHGRADERSAQP